MEAKSSMRRGVGGERGIAGEGRDLVFFARLARRKLRKTCAVETGQKVE